MHSITRRQTLADLLHRSAARMPNKLAWCAAMSAGLMRSSTASATSVAAGLAERGVTKGSRVAVLSRNSHAFVAMRFALARLGAVLVPINFMLKAEEVAYILRHAGATAGHRFGSRRAGARGGRARHLRARTVWLPSEAGQRTGRPT